MFEDRWVLIPPALSKWARHYFYYGNLYGIRPWAKAVEGSLETYLAARGLQSLPRKSGWGADPLIQYDMGRYYHTSLEVPQMERHQALEWYQSSAQAGYPSGMLAMAHCYQYGIGVCLDLRQSLDWEQAYANAVKNQPNALQYQVAQALVELTRKHQEGEIGSGVALAYCYLYGIGIRQSLEKAFELVQEVIRVVEERQEQGQLLDQKERDSYRAAIELAGLFRTYLGKGFTDLSFWEGAALAIMSTDYSWQQRATPSVAKSWLTCQEWKDFKEVRTARYRWPYYANYEAQLPDDAKMPLALLEIEHRQLLDYLRLNKWYTQLIWLKKSDSGVIGEIPEEDVFDAKKQEMDFCLKYRQDMDAKAWIFFAQTRGLNLSHLYLQGQHFAGEYWQNRHRLAFLILTQNQGFSFGWQLLQRNPNAFSWMRENAYSWLNNVQDYVYAKAGATAYLKTVDYQFPSVFGGWLDDDDLLAFYKFILANKKVLTQQPSRDSLQVIITRAVDRTHSQLEFITYGGVCDPDWVKATDIDVPEPVPCWVGRDSTAAWIAQTANVGPNGAARPAQETHQLTHAACPLPNEPDKDEATVSLAVSVQANQQWLQFRGDCEGGDAKLFETIYGHLVAHRLIAIWFEVVFYLQSLEVQNLSLSDFEKSCCRPEFEAAIEHLQKFRAQNPSYYRLFSRWIERLSHQKLDEFFDLDRLYPALDWSEHWKQLFLTLDPIELTNTLHFRSEDRYWFCAS